MHQGSVSQLRGQAASDYIVGLGLVLVLAVGIIVPALGKEEVTVALAAARSGAIAYIASNNSLTLDSITYNITAGNIVYFSPTLFFGPNRYYSPGLEAAMATSISQTISPDAISGNLNLSSDCVQGLFNKYCIVN